MIASCRICTARCKAVLPSPSRSLTSTPESRRVRTTPWWPLSMEMWSKGLLSTLSEGEGACVGNGVCLRDEAGVGGAAVAVQLG